jgi:hypothetical protein
MKFLTYIHVVVDGVHVRYASDWAKSGTTPRQHAMQHGFAASVKDGVLVTCTIEDGKLVRRNFGNAIVKDAA